MIASEPLPHFVDDLLSYLHETHPTHAALDGVHAHDDLLEDLGREAIENETHALAGYMRRLAEIRREGLTPVERLEHKMLTANLESRLFELEAVRTWERNPQLYSDLLASSLAGQTLFSHAPATERARRVLSKLRQAPRLIQAARDNIKDPPGIFVKVGIETMRGALKFIDHELPRAFAGSRQEMHLRSATPPTPRPKTFSSVLRQPTSSSWRPRRRRKRARRSGSDATSSSASCGWRKASASRSSACCSSPSASCTRRRRNSGRSPGA